MPGMANVDDDWRIAFRFGASNDSLAGYTPRISKLTAITRDSRLLGHVATLRPEKSPLPYRSASKNCECIKLRKHTLTSLLRHRSMEGLSLTRVQSLSLFPSSSLSMSSHTSIDIRDSSNHHRLSPSNRPLSCQVDLSELPPSIPPRLSDAQQRDFLILVR
jgi:hypothetical protein